MPEDEPQINKKEWFIVLKTASGEIGSRVERAFFAKDAFEAARKRFDKQFPDKQPWIVIEMHTL